MSPSSLDASGSGKREEDRRALRWLYSLYTIQHLVLAFVLVVAIVGELMLLDSPAFPQFVVYPLVLVTAIPAIISLYFTIHWWRMRTYALSLPLDAVQEALSASHRGAYEDHGKKHSPRFIVEGMKEMDDKRVVLVLLVVFLLSLPLSYCAVSGPTLAILALVAAVSFVAGALAVFLIPPLASRSAARRIAGGKADKGIASGGDGGNNSSMTDEVLSVLSGQAERLRLTANEQMQNQSANRTLTRARIDLGDLPDRIVNEISGLSEFKSSLLFDQRENLTRVVSSLVSTTIALGLPAEAARIYSAYRTIIPK